MAKPKKAKFKVGQVVALRATDGPHYGRVLGFATGPDCVWIRVQTAASPVAVDRLQGNAIRTLWNPDYTRPLNRRERGGK